MACAGQLHADRVSDSCPAAVEEVLPIAVCVAAASIAESRQMGNRWEVVYHHEGPPSCAAAQGFGAPGVPWDSRLLD